MASEAEGTAWQRGGVEKPEFNVVAGRERQMGLEARGQAAGAERPAEGLWSYAQAMSCQCGSVLSRLFRR